MKLMTLSFGLDLTDTIIVDGKRRVRQPFEASDQYNKNNRILKYAFDRLTGLVGLSVLSPIIFLCAFSIRVESALRPISRGPVFISEGRYSGGRVFRMWKFRTFQSEPPSTRTTDDKLVFINKLPTTFVGAVLKKFYLDELPQLFNILRGDMSLVGPRPWEIEHYKRHYPDTLHAKRLLRCGVCGPVQASKGLTSDFDGLLQMDETLARNYLSRSAVGVLLIDLRFITLTLRTMLRAEGL
jgi:lipopolysaccharide/colanic/teichoic acid biosynthesis glycosyltransferase